MSHSEKIDELAAALSKAQGEMQAAIKDKLNPFYKSSYADLGSVWDAARPVLSKNGLCVMQTTEMSADAAKIILVTTLAHTSGQWMKSFLPLSPSKNDSQGVGAAITYLRRYSLSALVGVVCDDDDDGETVVGRGKTQEATQAPKEEKSSPVENVGDSEITVLHDLMKKLDEDSKKSFNDWIKKEFSANSLHGIPKSSFDRCITCINNKIKYINDKKKQQAEVA